jgi:hypothetical protein
MDSRFREGRELRPKGYSACMPLGMQAERHQRD